jgi:hypothetical protein
VESAVFGLVGVVVGALLAGIREWWFQNRKNKKDAEYLVIQVSCRLEKFIAGCAGVAGDDGLCEGQTDKDGYSFIQVEAPTLVLSDLEVEWKVLPVNLMYAILQLPYKAELVAQWTRYEFNHASPPDYSEAFEERQLQYSILGIDASRLVTQLLKHVALPEAKPDEWDPIAFMREQKARIDGLRQKRATDSHNLF